MKRIILNSCNKVLNLTKNVEINFDKIIELSHSFTKVPPLPEYGLSHHYIGTDDDIARYIVLFNLLNYSFYGKPRWGIEYKNKKFTGAFAMWASLARALNEGKSLFDIDYLKNINTKEATYLFRGFNVIPMLTERVQDLREFGKVVEEKFEKDILNIIKNSNQSGARLVSLLANNFSTFADIQTYDNLKVYFYKKAQLVVSCLYWGLQGKKWGLFKDLDELTVFADYVVPRSLRAFNILSYSEDLTYKVDNEIEIEFESKQEIEIRATTIIAGERIQSILEKKFPNVTAIHVDAFLWHYGKTKKIASPFHQTRTKFY